MDEERFGQWIEWPLERKCAVCGRIFCMVCTPEEWPLKDKANRIVFCSWHCLREWEKSQASRQKSRAAPKRPPKEKEKVFREYFEQGMNNQEIAEATGCSEQLVNYYRRKTERRSERDDDKGTD